MLNNDLAEYAKLQRSELYFLQLCQVAHFCHYAECHSAECRGAISIFILKNSLRGFPASSGASPYPFMANKISNGTARSIHQCRKNNSLKQPQMSC
jgi:hypothetical protein